MNIPQNYLRGSISRSKVNLNHPQYIHLNCLCSNDKDNTVCLLHNNIFKNDDNNFGREFNKKL